MLDEATPRAQLHLQRVMGRMAEGNTIAENSLFMSNPVRKFASNQALVKNRSTVIAGQTGSSHHRVDVHDRPTTVGCVSHSSSSNGRPAASVKGRMSSPRKGIANSASLKTSRTLFDSLDDLQENDLLIRSSIQETSPKSSTQQVQRTNCVSSVKPVVQPDRACMVLDAEEGTVNTYTNGSVNGMSFLLQQVEENESCCRGILEEMIFTNMDGLRQSSSSEEVLIRLLSDTASAVTQVVDFVRTPAEEVVRYPKAHLALFGDAAQQNYKISIKDLLFYLQHMPAAIAKNYMHLNPSNQNVNEMEEPSPILWAPQPHPHEEQEQTMTSDATCLHIRRPSSLFSCCESLPRPIFRSCQQYGGSMSSNMAFPANGSLDSAEDLPSTSTLIMCKTMCRVERDTDALLAVEDLREETAYWQEETLRAMSEAERHLQMVYTVLGSSLSSPLNGNGEMGYRKMSVTSLGSTAQRSAVHRAFSLMLSEMEEGKRGKIESEEALERWQCWFSAMDELQSVSKNR